jgi:hypothetical protein
MRVGWGAGWVGAARRVQFDGRETGCNGQFHQTLWSGVNAQAGHQSGFRETKGGVRDVVAWCGI